MNGVVKVRGGEELSILCGPRKSSALLPYWKNCVLLSIDDTGYVGMEKKNNLIVYCYSNTTYTGIEYSQRCHIMRILHGIQICFIIMLIRDIGIFPRILCTFLRISCQKLLAALYTPHPSKASYTYL